MRIAFLGNFNPEFSTESDIFKTLRIMGHEVFEMQESIWTDGPAAVLKEEIESRDMLLWIHTNGWSYGDITNEWMRKLKVPSVMITLDLYRNLKRQKDVNNPNFSAKYVFTADGSTTSSAKEFWKRHGVNHFWFPPGILETNCYRAAPDPQHEAYGKIIFVGSRTYHEEWPWRQRLIEFCNKTYGSDFIVYDHSSGMRGHKLNVLYASAACVVGDSCFAGQTDRYWSDRYPETLGRGGRLVWPYIRGQASTLINAWRYKPCVPGSLKRAIDRIMLVPPTEAKLNQIVKFVKEHHTYTKRMQMVFDIVSKQEPSIKKALESNSVT